jgi:hypothetical protein
MTIRLTANECKLIVQEDHEDYEIIDCIDKGRTGRWHNLIKIIFKDLNTNYDYKFYYNQAATEYQEDQYSDSVCRKVVPVQQDSVVWIEVNEENDYDNN